MILGPGSYDPIAPNWLRDGSRSSSCFASTRKYGGSAFERGASSPHEVDRPSCHAPSPDSQATRGQGLLHEGNRPHARREHQEPPLEQFVFDSARRGGAAVDRLAAHGAVLPRPLAPLLLRPRYGSDRARCRLRYLLWNGEQDNGRSGQVHPEDIQRNLPLKNAHARGDWHLVERARPRLLLRKRGVRLRWHSSRGAPWALVVLRSNCGRQILRSRDVKERTSVPSSAAQRDCRKGLAAHAPSRPPRRSITAHLVCLGLLWSGGVVGSPCTVFCASFPVRWFSSGSMALRAL